MRKEESDNSDNTNSDKIEETNNKETEKLPQTGLETTKLLEIELLALGAAIMVRRKQKQ